MLSYNGILRQQIYWGLVLLNIVFTSPGTTTANLDRSEMALIPGGTFEMGNQFAGTSGASESVDDNVPVHTVKIYSFYMDKYEVTVGQFKRFLQETGYEFNRSLWQRLWVSPTDDHPIVNVDWYAATAYADWAGKRLPTEAEWEYAARGALVGMRFPWGNEITHDDANFHRTWGKGITHDYPNFINTGGKDRWRYSTAPVGSFEPNGYGLYDMAGNVAEWCQDWYSSDYYLVSPADNSKGPETGETKVTRGGHWYSWDKGLRVYNRGDNPPDVEWFQDVQEFRLVSDLE